MLAGKGIRTGSDFFGRSHHHDLATAAAAFRTEIHQMVRGFDDIQIMLDHHNRIAIPHEPVEDLEQSTDIFKMHTGRRFIQNIKRLARGSSRQLLGAVSYTHLTLPTIYSV